MGKRAAAILIAALAGFIAFETVGPTTERAPTSGDPSSFSARKSSDGERRLASADRADARGARANDPRPSSPGASASGAKASDDRSASSGSHAKPNDAPASAKNDASAPSGIPANGAAPANAPAKRAGDAPAPKPVPSKAEGPAAAPPAESVQARWERRLTREDEILVAQAVEHGCDATRADKARAILAEKRAARARTLDDLRAGRINRDQLKAQARAAKQTADAKLREVLKPDELAAFDLEGARAQVIDEEKGR